MNKEAIIQEVLNLSEKDKADIANILFESISRGIPSYSEEQWSIELMNRITQFEENTVKYKTWRALKKELT